VKAITIRQPWAWCVAAGHKPVENRTRAVSYRGDVAVHAGLRWSAEGQRDPRVRGAWTAARLANPARNYQLGRLRPESPAFTFGAVLAVAELADCHPATDGCCTSLWADPPRAGLRVHHLVLANLRPLRAPVPAAGRQPVPWTLPAEAENAVRAALAAEPAGPPPAALPPIHQPTSVREALDTAAAAVHAFHDQFPPDLCTNPGCRAVAEVYRVAFGASPKGAIRL
jgi:hypothetical protein